MSLPSQRAQSPFEKYVATEAAVPGKAGASAALIAEFNAMNRGTFVFVAEDNALYMKASSGLYADGNRIVLVSSGSSGTEGVDSIYTNVAVLVVGDLVTKDGTANRVALADASDGTLPAFGVVVDVIDATTCVVRQFGEVDTITGGGAFTPGGTVYLSETAGTATQTPPATAGSVVQKIGFAKSTTEVILGITPAFGGGTYTINGTAAQPSMSFVSDPDTGLYRSAANTIGIATGGVASATLAPTGFTFTQQTTNGSATALTVTAGTIASAGPSSETTDVYFNLSHSISFADSVGPFVTERVFRINPPVLVGSPTGAETITDAFAFAIDNAPTAGSNMTITNRWVAGFTSDTVVGLNATYANALLYRRTVTLGAGVGAAGIGLRNVYQLPNDAGTEVNAGFIGATFTNVAAAGSTGVMEIIPAYAGSAFVAADAGLRVTANALAMVNGLEVRPVTAAAAAATGVVLAPYGATANTSLALEAKGTGNLTFALAGAGTIDINAGAGGSVQVGGDAAALVGFYAIGPVVQQVLATGAAHTVDEVITFLQLIGLCKQA